jgi:protease-4
MKSFLKYLLASVLGVIIAMAVLFFIGMGVVGSIMSISEKPAEIKENTVLKLELNKPIVDRSPPIPFNLALLGGEQQLGLNSILANIEKAKKDNNIAGIYLDFSYVPAGIATINEIRDALLDFKTSGKFVICYGDFFTQAGYYLASAADKVYLNPAGFISFVGLRSEVLFFKGTFDKLDIEPEVIRYGAFKSAGEPYVNEKMSDEYRQQISAYLSDVWEYTLEKLSETRPVSPAQLNNIADNLKVNDAEAAVSLGLVDSLLYEDEVMQWINRRLGVADNKEVNAVNLKKYDRVPKMKDYKGLANDKIAVIYASGVIMPGEGDNASVGAETYAKAFRKAREDSSIKAVVLRITSPGGSALGSEIIWREAVLTRQVKPLVVSMGDYAASGGYYIACLADTIVASPTSLTGSIGVIGIHFNLKQFMKKLGITIDVERTNNYADFASAFRELKPEEREFWQHFTDKIYHDFVSHVAEGRGMTYEQVDDLGQGKIWSGTDAKANGLIDKHGGLNDAVAVAKNMAGLSDKYRLVDLPKQHDPLEELINQWSENTKLKALANEFGAGSQYVEQINYALKNQGIMTRMPMLIRVY